MIPLGSWCSHDLDPIPELGSALVRPTSKGETAYREIGMWEILEVLQRVACGERQRAIPQFTGRSSIRHCARGARARLGRMARLIGVTAHRVPGGRVLPGPADPSARIATLSKR
jgi:hypothetical protein